MKTNTARLPMPTGPRKEPEGGPLVRQETPLGGFGPQSAGRPLKPIGERPSLRMYTEEEVSEMLQISLSQLRKWRMKQNRGSAQGPPFKKIGRLVRYPEQGLIEFINGR